MGAATVEKCGGRVLRKLKTEVPYEPAIPLRGMYPKKTTALT